MLEMCGRLTILCTTSPTVFFGELDVFGTHAHHRLDCNNHTFFQQSTRAVDSIVADVGVFVHLESDTVSAKFTHNGIAVLLAMLLDGMAYVPNAVTRFATVEAKIKSLFGNFEETLHLRFDFADSESIGRIADIAVKFDDTINRNIVAFVEEQLLARNAMNHHIVYRHTEGTWETFESFAKGYSTIVTDKLLANLVQKSGRDARFHVASDLRKRSPYKECRTTDKFYLFFSLEQYHRFS